MHLSSNRSQMTSKCGKIKEVAHEAIAECVTDVLTTFWLPLWSIYGQMHGTWNLFVLCNKELNFVLIKAAQFFSRKARESWTFPILTNTQKAIWSHLWSKQNEAIPLVAMPCQELWLVLENHPSVKLDSSVASLEMKTYSEARTGLQNIQF